MQQQMQSPQEPTRTTSLWQKVKQHRMETILICVVALLSIVVILGYVFGWSSVGVDPSSQTTTTTQNGSVTIATTTQAGVSLWNWIQILIVPAVLATGAFLLNRMQSQRDKIYAEKRSKTETDIAQDNQQEVALQTYLNDMRDLLLVHNLKSSAEDAEVRVIARMLTLTVLLRLNGVRKGRVIQFLYEGGLISSQHRIVNLEHANLNEAHLVKAILHGADLSQVDLTKADLYRADLKGANLKNATLYCADLTQAQLGKANLEQVRALKTILSWADLKGAHLVEAFLSEADLKNASLNNADLTGAYLLGAILSEARPEDDGPILAHLWEGSPSMDDLSKAGLIVADLNEANLMGANLSGANLTRALYTDEQLKQARSCKGAMMQDGKTKHP